jgi:hypothetical protein
MGYYVPPGISDATVPNPIFNLTPAATVDEGNNWININWGPLSLSNPSVVRPAGTNAPALGNYGPAAGSPVINYVPSSATSYAAAPSFDFYGTARKSNNAVDAGAVEFAGAAPTATLAVAPTSLAFGNQASGSTSTAQTLTLSNTGGATATGIAVAVATTSTPTTPNQFARAGGTCTGTTLAAGASCTIGVTFSPTSTGAKSGTVTITASVAVSGSPVALSGTGTAVAPSTTLTPTTWTTSATRGCTGSACPGQVFTLTNTGTVNVTGIAQAALGGANASEFSILRSASTCGPAGGGQSSGQVTLAPGSACTVTVRFTPLTTQTTGVKNATVAITYTGGSQSSALTGTAN